MHATNNRILGEKYINTVLGDGGNIPRKKLRFKSEIHERKTWNISEIMDL